MIKVTFADGTGTSPVIWVSMVPWTRSAMTVHVPIPGGDGIGRTFSKGQDSAVTTLQGRVPWTAEGERMYDRLAGARVTVSNGLSTRTGIAGTPTVSGDATAWIFFSLTVTEDTA